MFTDGLKLMITGMGTVFIFLSLMILIINLLSKILAPYSSLLEAKKNTAAVPQFQKTADSADADKALISAIMIAVHKFREKRSI